MPLQTAVKEEFDPSNASHREAVKKFLVRNAWADSPIKFSLTPPYPSLADQVKTQLLDWYLSKEFTN